MMVITDYEKTKKRFGFLLSVPMLFAILHAIGQILLQSFLRFKTDTMTYSACPGLGLGYSSSLLSAILVSGKQDADFVNSLSSCFSILFTILLILFSSFAAKGKLWGVSALLITYAIDTIMTLPLLLVDALASYPLKLALADKIMNPLFHLLFVGFLLYLFLLSRSLARYENEN